MIRNQNDYDCFGEGQFAADEYFQQWVLGADSASNRFWESYLLLHPAQVATIKKARQLVKALASGDYHLQPLSAGEKLAMKENVYLALDLPFSAQRDLSIYGWKKKLVRWSAVAASLVIVLSLYFFIGFGRGKNGDNILSVSTGQGEIKRVALADSTVVILNANSALRFSNHFQTGSDRTVTLSGNAFFNVEKDPGHRPFVVRAGSLIVTVLGTELNVNARSAETEVELTRGKVKVEQAGHAANPVYLLPGEKIKLDSGTGAFVKSTMDAKLYSAWTSGQWNFHQTTLEDITALLHEYYGVEVVFNSERSRRSRINAVMAVTNLSRLIPVIEQTLQIKIELINNRLIVQ